MSYNKAYHSFFEGYTEKQEVDPNTGKVHIKRTYAGDFYVAQMEEAAWKRNKILYVALYVWSVIALILQGVGRSATEWYIVVPVFLGILAEILLGVQVFARLGHSRRLNIRQYRERETLKGASMGGTLALGLTLIGQAAWMVQHREFYWYWAVCVAAAAGGAAALRFLFCRERDIEYFREKNTVKVDPDSYDIRYREIDQP